MQLEVYDLETLKNCFTATFYNPSTKKVSQFAIHKDWDDRRALYNFISQELALIGFNCVNFDTPILQYFYDNWEDPKIVSKIYKLAQRFIDSDHRDYSDVRWPQRDLMKIWHFDNDAKRASLKWLQINMGFENVMDMPIKHSDLITKDQIPTVLEYNLNDVMATNRLYELSASKIRLRKRLGEKYGTDMGNFNDPKIGEYIILKMLADKIGISIEGLRKCRTPREKVALSDVIIPEIKFESKEFQKIYEGFKQTTVSRDTTGVDFSATMDGVEYFFGLGGIHGCRGTDIYNHVHSCDVTGYYPSLAVAKHFAPAHFGDSFIEVYRQIAIERSSYPKGSDDNTALKLAQNGTFGKTNSEYSPFYDPKMFYQITINGQLLLAMLCERVTLSGAGRVILANTDGIEVDVLDKEKYMKVCKEWEEMIGLHLEHSVYKKLIVKDINNYLAVKENGGVKEKGMFICEPEMEKDHSMLVVPKTLKKYFSDGGSIPEIVKSHPIEDFLIGARAKVGHFYTRKIENFAVKDEPLQKHLRYYISRRGDVLRKKTEATDNAIHVGEKVSFLNTMKPGPYDIKYEFYIREVTKILEMFVKPLTL